MNIISHLLFSVHLWAIGRNCTVLTIQVGLLLTRADYSCNTVDTRSHNQSDKCKFLSNSNDYLGHAICSDIQGIPLQQETFITRATERKSSVALRRIRYLLHNFPAL